MGFRKVSFKGNIWIAAAIHKIDKEPIGCVRIFSQSSTISGDKAVPIIYNINKYDS